MAKDVAEVLGYSETSMMTRRLDDDEVMSAKLAGMNMNSTLITESGLYNAILGSNKPEAKNFKKWITSEVLPTIRKHGMYATDITIEKMISNPDRAGIYFEKSIRNNTLCKLIKSINGVERLP